MSVSLFEPSVELCDQIRADALARFAATGKETVTGWEWAAMLTPPEKALFKALQAAGVEFAPAPREIHHAVLD